MRCQPSVTRHPTPTTNRKGLPLPVSVKPHPFLLVFLFFCRRGTWTAQKSGGWSKVTPRPELPSPRAFPGSQGNPASYLPASRLRGPLIPGPSAAAPTAPSRGAPQPALRTLLPSSPPAFPTCAPSAGRVHPQVPRLPRSAARTHLGARSSSCGQPGSSQLGRPPSLAAPGGPGRPRPKGDGLTFERQAGRSEGPRRAPRGFSAPLVQNCPRPPPLVSPLGPSGAPGLGPATPWHPPALWAP